MNKWKTERRYTYGVAGALCLAALMIGGRPMGNQQQIEASTAQTLPKSDILVVVKPQEDSPLLITGMKIADSTDPRMPVVEYTITNNTKKRIMAFAIRYDAMLADSTISGSITANYPDYNRALQPHIPVQSEVAGIQYPKPPVSIILSVDFVEFAGGRRWGPDTYKHGELIDGVRAGVKKAKEVMLKALETDGTEAFVHSLDAIKVAAEPSPAHSSEWLEGFRHGVGWLRERVRNKGKDVIEIRRELLHTKS